MATILCINGDLRFLEVQKALLEGRGYRVLIAPNGASGIEISRKQSVDAVVLDFKPAAMDGDQVADVLAKEQPNLPFVICSDFPDAVPESLKWLADALLQTSAAPEALTSAIENLIAARSTIKQ
jgi:CheY-like chemotaxis protein